MNERIREILVQCQHESIDGPEYPRWTDLEKFAELVWWAAYEEGYDAGVDAGFEAGRNASFTEQHFGVEE